MNADSRYKPFVREIEAASGRFRASDVFVDACHLMAADLWRRLCFGEARRKAEADYNATREKFNAEEFDHLANAGAVLIEALEADRHEFLGQCMNLFEATNKWNGQVLTPSSLAQLMGRITAPTEEEHGELIRLHDPCCGAGVLLIDGAEEYRKSGHSQADICIVASDIDYRACDMTYIQLSLLGYAACVQQVDALTLKAYGEARYTIGWFLHGFPMRRIAA